MLFYHMYAQSAQKKSALFFFLLIYLYSNDDKMALYILQSSGLYTAYAWVYLIVVL